MDSSFLSHSPSDTRRIARELLARLSPGMFVGLTGPLGAGKTEFVRGMADEIGAANQVSSPSYVLEQLYQGSSVQLSHWDLYRVSEKNAPDELRDYLGSEDTIVVVEWPERVSWVVEMLDVSVAFQIESDETRKIDVVNR